MHEGGSGAHQVREPGQDIDTRGARPSAPSAHARSPNAVEPSDCTPPPLTRSGTGSAVCAFRTQDVEWSRRDRHDRGREVDGSQDLGEEPGVDRGDDVALVLGTAVVRGHIGPLDVDVQRVVSGERVHGQPRPLRVLGRRRHPSARRCPGEAPPRGASRASSRCRARRASRRSSPTPGRSGRGCSAASGRWSPPSRVRIRFAGSWPRAPALGVHLRRVQDLRRLLHEQVRQLGGVVGLVGVRQRFAVRHNGFERLERDAERSVLAVGGIGVRHLRGQRTRRPRGSRATRDARRSPSA